MTISPIIAGYATSLFNRHHDAVNYNHENFYLYGAECGELRLLRRARAIDPSENRGLRST